MQVGPTCPLVFPSPRLFFGRFLIMHPLVSGVRAPILLVCFCEREEGNGGEGNEGGYLATWVIWAAHNEAKSWKQEARCGRHIEA
jgi:hypothetical protein